MSESGAPALQRMGRIDRVVAILLAGGLSGFLAAFFSISDATFLFGLSVPEALAAGIGVALLSTAVLSAVTALTSAIPGVVAETQEVPLATLAVIAASVPAMLPAGAGEAAVFTTLLCTIGLSTLSAGLFFYVLGRFRLGRFIRFVPLPVIAGFIAGMGMILLLGSLEVTGGLALSFDEIDAWLSGSTLLKLALAVIVVIALQYMPRLLGGTFGMPAALLGAILLFHSFEGFLGPNHPALAREGWFVKTETTTDLWRYFELVDFAEVEWRVILAEGFTVWTMIVVSAMALLMTAGAIELAIRKDIDLNRELKAAGAANVCTGLIGGIAGFHGFGLTVLNWRLRATSRATGLIAALVCVVVLLVGVPILDVVPIPVFGGMMLWLSLTLLKEWLVDTWHRVGKGEYLVILLIVVVIASMGFLEGLLVGLVAGTILFVVDYSRVDIVNARLSGRHLHSSTEFSAGRRRLLDEHGDAILILRLQGYIFFGTADRLRERILGWLSQEKERPIGFLVIDFRRASGMDSSAALSFVKLAQHAGPHDLRIVLTGLSDHVQAVLRRAGLSLQEDGSVRAFSTLDRGLRWCEHELLDELAERLPQDEAEMEHEQLLQGFGGQAEIDRLLSYMERLELPAGSTLVEQGADSQEMYFIESGRVSVYLAKPDGEQLRLKLLGPGTTIGEMAFYLTQHRSATVVCELPSTLWRFTREDLQRMEREASDLAASFHQRMAMLLSERLAATDRLVQVLID